MLLWLGGELHCNRTFFVVSNMVSKQDYIYKGIIAIKNSHRSNLVKCKEFIEMNHWE
jgi:hypothetical protein